GRKIGKEPEYKSSPQYCLLVFGPEAKTPMWLVLDRHLLYLDRNGSGDLTEPGKHISKWKDIDIGAIDIDGTPRQARLTVAYRGCPGVQLEFQVGDNFRQSAGTDEANLTFASRPQDAPIVHFGGPLTVRCYHKVKGLVHGEYCRFTAGLGTPGLGAGTFASVSALPAEAKLAAEINFPHQDPEQPR